MINRAAIRSYDGVSRFLHWAMALLIFWQLGGMLAEKICGETPFIKSWTGTHSSIGMTLLVLALVRLTWALVQRKRRPARSASLVGTASRIGHMAFYVIMIVLPAIALMRSIGSGRGVKFFGQEIWVGSGEKIPALMAPANAVHGLLGWTFLALIIGHIVMTFFHHFALKDGTLTKMLPKVQKVKR